MKLAKQLFFLDSRMRSIAGLGSVWHWQRKVRWQIESDDSGKQTDVKGQCESEEEIIETAMLCSVGRKKLLQITRC